MAECTCVCLVSTWLCVNNTGESRFQDLEEKKKMGPVVMSTPEMEKEEQMMNQNKELEKHSQLFFTMSNESAPTCNWFFLYLHVVRVFRIHPLWTFKSGFMDQPAFQSLASCYKLEVHALDKTATEDTS